MADVDGLETTFTGWHCWRGVSGIWYARRVRSSPPVVLRAESLAELKELVRKYIAGH
jgi:hypothetical protein